jgi:hypothetical protein
VRSVQKLVIPRAPQSSRRAEDGTRSRRFSAAPDPARDKPRHLQAFVRVGDDKLDAAQAAPDKVAQEVAPERLHLGLAASIPITSRRPHSRTPCAIRRAQACFWRRAVGWWPVGPGSAEESRERRGVLRP